MNIQIYNVHALLNLITGEEDAMTASDAFVDGDTSSQSETEMGTTKLKALPPPPLDINSVVALEEDQKSVPSQSDVMDILSIASKGSNEVTSENLRQVTKKYMCDWLGISFIITLLL